MAFQIFPVFILIIATSFWLYTRWYPIIQATHNLLYPITSNTYKENRKEIDLYVGILYSSIIQHNLKNKNLEKMVMLFMALVLTSNAWDTELNPGLYQYKGKYLCMACNKAAKWGQEALACDGCQAWYHREYLEMRLSNYECLKISNCT